MIHDIELPEITEKCLLSIVQLQMTLLEYAASEPTISCVNCGNYLSQKNPPFKDCGQQIAKALWSRSRSFHKPSADDSSQELKSIKLLKDFSAAFHGSDDSRPEYNNLDFKQSWLKRVRQEIESFANFTTAKVEIGYFYGNSRNYIKSKMTGRNQPTTEVAPVWQQKAGEFFLYFYKTYLEDSKDGFPANFFPFDITTLLPERKHFGRQELLHLFRTKNSDLYTCPVCDENGYYTDSRGAMRATLDHFLPKDIYPHFACHPHNVFPTCYSCNSSVKGLRDPLHKKLTELGPGSLYEEALPYTKTRWKKHIFLAVDLSRGLKEIRLNNLQYNAQQQGLNEEGLYSAFEIFARVYDIPGRWATGQKIQENQARADNSLEENESSAQQETKPDDVSVATSKSGFAADRVSETLFRRMRHFLGQGKDMMSGDHMIDELYHTLSLLLYYLSEEDRYKDPLTIPMLWILAALLAQERQQLLRISELQKAGILPKDRQFIPAGLDEVLSWSGQDSSEIERRANTIQTILKLATNRSDY